MQFIGKYDPLKNEKIQILDNQGNIINNNIEFDISDETLIEAYKIMNLSRKQDEFQNIVQRQGRLLSFLSSSGQEACEVAYAMSMEKGVDWLSPGYRNNAAWLASGIPVRNIMLYWTGNEFGGQSPEGINVLPPNIIIGSQYSQAAGLAFGEKYLNKKGVVLTTTGDGGMSEGEVYESMNFAQLHNLPVIFICENNKWAISTPYSKSTKSLNIAVKAIASGTPSLIVDGNDFLACYAVIQECLKFCREGNGPVFIEFDTYRLGAHSSSDNPDVYRPKDEFEKAKLDDPLTRMKNYLVEKGIWSKKKQEALDSEQFEFLKTEFEWAEKNKDYPVSDVFDYIYDQKPDFLVEQLAEAKTFYPDNENKFGGDK
ncbi:pyruvate dehydrogenase E1 component subunit alpha [Spiroplasma chinense]|uniref:Pyruvate dehydrogenase E1 component subunit alpha n=1 Tax=Spiroplasma chinense TaxID=216932 RepID=A0A5B9Y5M3_9MOLU|nr:pyruvate dehydrogenase (acetyl-transferring) E1 component subunit alpha [Spiroplasma chinense]QEH62026.1 pyruvate dehydrogenase E1 component subunit alpha [Spiroplasma chinense]